MLRMLVCAVSWRKPRWIMSFVKSDSLLRREATRAEKFELMQQEKANYSIKRMARLLKVSRSGYYKWADTQQKRLSGENDRAAFYDGVDRKIHQIWKDSDEVYGAPRITAELTERYQITLNRKTVAKRMRMMGIEGISPRAFVPVTTIQSKRKSALPDLVKRMFDTGELNRVWMSDITYLRTSEDGCTCVRSATAIPQGAGLGDG